MRCVFLMHLICVSVIAYGQSNIQISSVNENEIIEFIPPVIADDESAIISNSFYDIPNSRFPEKSRIEQFRSDSRFKYVIPEEKKEDSEPNWLAKFFMNIFGGIAEFFAWLFGSGVLTFVVIVLVVFVVLAIAMKMANIDLKQVFAKKWKEELNEVDILQGENTEITGFDKLINDALSAKDYRLAIRYMYLRNLKALSDKNIIQWAENKTNYSYQAEIQNKDIRDRFLATTILFDYVWYGEFIVDDSNFSIASSKLNDLNQMIINEK